MYSKLLIKRITVQVKVDRQSNSFNTWDFEVDGVLLSERLQIDRSDLRFCMNDLGYDNRVVVERYFEELKGMVPASNQFGSGRVRLYGCHCGCDYCGMISMRLVVTPETVEWLDIRHEDDRPGPVLLAQLVFRRDKYMQALDAARSAITGEKNGGNEN
jgi:hypothetical protein